jgi:hypothetical protein
MSDAMQFAIACFHFSISGIRVYFNIWLHNYSKDSHTQQFLTTSNTCKSPTRRKNFSSSLLDTYLQINMFRASSRPSSGAHLQ